MAIGAKGPVKRIYASRDRAFIRLADLPPELIPGSVEGGEGYFSLHRDHENYNALYSLALAAAVNRYELSIRTVADIKPGKGGENAEIEYLVVDWP